MRPSSKRALSLLASMIFFIGSLVIYVNFIKPTYDKIDLLRGELETKRQQYGDYKNIIDRLRPVFDSFQSASQLQQSFSSMLPTNPMVPQAVAQINGLARASLMSINSININELAVASQKTSLLKGAGIIDLNLAMNSNSYESIKSFLQNTESNIRIFDVKRINVSKKDNTNSFSVSLDVYGYYQVQ